jgi:hypothetical protein
MAATVALESPTVREPGRIRRTLLQGRRKYVAGLLALLLLPGSAYAAWTVSSHGRGAVKGGTLRAPTFGAATPSDTDTLLPSGDAALTFEVTNPNPTVLHVESLDPGPDGVISSDQSNCPAANVSIPNLRNLSIQVPRGQSTVVVPNAIHMAADAPSSCSGVSFQADASLGFST